MGTMGCILAVMGIMGHVCGRGVLTEYLWGTYGIFMGQRGTYGALMGQLWGTYGALMGQKDTYGVFMGQRGTYGVFMGQRGSYGVLMGQLWGTYGAESIHVLVVGAVGVAVAVAACGDLWGHLGTYGDL